jgi:hypothetical protein
VNKHLSRLLAGFLVVIPVAMYLSLAAIIGAFILLDIQHWHTYGKYVAWALAALVFIYGLGWAEEKL